MSDPRDIALAEAWVPPAEECGENLKRRQILDGAREVFLARGFDGASMGEIAKVAGVSKGTLYVYFDSKDKLFAALTAEEKAGLAEVLFKLDTDDPDIRSVLAKLGRTYLRHMSQPEHVSSIRMVIGAAEKFPHLSSGFFEAGPCQGIARLRAYLDKQNEAGRLSADDTGVAAQHFLDLCGASTMRRLLFAVGEVPTEREIDTIVDNAMHVFFAAYGPKAVLPGSFAPE